MILRRLTPAVPNLVSDPRPASEIFLESQAAVPPPFAIVLQIAHSELAGELVRRLLPETFGPIPPPVIEAAWKHDLGWADSDQRQMNLLPNVPPKPFPQIASSDELPSWLRSLVFAESMPPLTRVLISRHLCTLATKPTATHDAFLAAEEDRRIAIEDTLDASLEDLERWTAAIGFCDLLSLYLCSGVTDPAVFPLAHPADPGADEARHVTLSWNNGNPAFSEPIFAPGTSLRIEAQIYNSDTGALRPTAVRWSI